MAVAVAVAVVVAVGVVVAGAEEVALVCGSDSDSGRGKYFTRAVTALLQFSTCWVSLQALFFRFSYDEQLSVLLVQVEGAGR